MFLHGAIRELTSGAGDVVKVFTDLTSRFSSRSSNAVAAVDKHTAGRLAID